jgi:hypothetical protein
MAPVAGCATAVALRNGASAPSLGGPGGPATVGLLPPRSRWPTPPMAGEGLRRGPAAASVEPEGVRSTPGRVPEPATMGWNPVWKARTGAWPAQGTLPGVGPGCGTPPCADWGGPPCAVLVTELSGIEGPAAPVRPPSLALRRARAGAAAAATVALRGAEGAPLEANRGSGCPPAPSPPRRSTPRSWRRRSRRPSSSMTRAPLAAGKARGGGGGGC